MSCKGAKSILGEKASCYDSKSNVAEENKRKFYLKLRNDKATFCKIQYDGCVYDGIEERCDYLFLVNLNGKIQEWVFVELKGQDVAKGIDQISASIAQIGELKIKKAKISAFVIPSRVPSKAHSGVNKSKEAFAKKHKVVVGIHNTEYTYTV